MDAIQVITDIISNIQTEDSPPVVLSFFYGSEAEQNFYADNGVFPAAILDFPIQSVFDVKQSGYVEQQELIKLFFCNKSKFDATPSENIIIIRECLAFAKKFLSRVQSNEYVKDFEDIRGEGVENLFDTHVSGYLLEISITFHNTDSNCF